MQSIQKTHDQGRHHLSAMGKRFFGLIEFDDDEELLLEIRKHPFGLFLILFSGTFVAFATLVATIGLVSSGILEEFGFGVGGSVESIIALLGLTGAVVIGILTLIFAQLYRSNVVFITDEKIAQVLYITIFNRKISQLNIGDVQDVTVTQQGIFAHLFNYGTLVIETAGEQQNYTFSFVPKPYPVSKVLIGAHEANLKLHGN